MGTGLTGRSVYAFGDSIVYGHVYPRSFVDVVAEGAGMALSKFARNGATIGADPHASGGQILAQVEQAPAVAPDFVLFDGGTNDAESVFKGRYDVGTYSAALERTLRTMKRRWPAAHLVYVSAHKLGSRDWDIQVALREETLRICRNGDVAIADVFGDTPFDTRDDVHRAKYTFDGLVDGLPGAEGSGTHPNMAGITTFYVPVVTVGLEQISSS
ncbi:SGNH/GDSL hydrolase family protein [Streptomyces sp. NEAU-H22]|uniref:SGNH/GDSL hydrolase family protein n=1 Tax=unclassified Streptomyces TaxID=2593676 RepID=UPI002254FBCD|nr:MULTISPECIES: SGNH/GDSL hydrolase family protein [unclassified Streptomyces]MCX3291873.1 SGNH/GDSL hydrolase family protein [Streptomyces sp. NEAU-H22]WMD06914.1 SGNH/GDSL hydrolase family protein [Streptomyces sp. FXY-T5]